jgi:cytochrome c oxidase subunit 1
VGIVFITSIFSPWALTIGLIPCAIALTAWFWPKELKRNPEPVIS